MKITLSVVGVILLIVGIGYFATNANQLSPQVTPVVLETTSNSQSPTEADVTSPQNAVTESVSDTETLEVTQAVDETQTATPAGTYRPYDAQRIAQSDAEHILLFFHATWCPSCRALDADISRNTDNIPAGVEIYKIDYDTSTELKRQYGVTTQHSIIEITASGEARSSISHGLTLQDILATL